MRYFFHHQSHKKCRDCFGEKNEIFHDEYIGTLYKDDFKPFSMIIYQKIGNIFEVKSSFITCRSFSNGKQGKNDDLVSL